MGHSMGRFKWLIFVVWHGSYSWIIFRDMRIEYVLLDFTSWCYHDINTIYNIDL